MNVELFAQQLAAHLRLTRPLVCVDLEATGVWPGQDRIVQIATATIFPDGRVSTWSSLVNPEQAIPAAAQTIHGISDTMAASSPTFAQLAPEIATLLAERDLTGYNVERYDRRLLAAEFRRVGHEDPMADARVIDAYTIFARQEPRSLDAALRFYGVETGEAARRQKRCRGHRRRPGRATPHVSQPAEDGRRATRLALPERPEPHRCRREARVA